MNTTITARVTCVQKNRFTVFCDDGTTIDAKLKGKFYNLQLENPVVGDYVKVETNQFGDGLIDQVLPRKTYFRRPNRSGHAESFVKNLLAETVVSNFDYIFIVTSLNQNYNQNRIARFAALTLQSGATPVIVLSKSDLCEDAELQVEITKAVCPKAEVFAVSSLTGYGLEELKKYLIPGKTIALLGSSGVGKSTLLNTLCGEDLMKVNAIRDEDGKGRHTTTYRQLFQMENGTWIMDTPGMRELGIIDAEEGIEQTFNDVTELFKDCRFNDCTHTCEPGCAVQAAIQEGTLDEYRWDTYRKLYMENKRSLASMKRRARQVSQMQKMGKGYKGLVDYKD